MKRVKELNGLEEETKRENVYVTLGPTSSGTVPGTTTGSLTFSLKVDFSSKVKPIPSDH